MARRVQVRRNRRSSAFGTGVQVVSEQVFKWFRNTQLASETSLSGSTALYSAVYDNTSHPRDALGRILHKLEMFGTTTATDAEYQYDARNRLWKVFEAGSATPSRTYAYDSNGNRLTLPAPSGTTSASYDDQDRLESYGSYTYSYTANGELETKTDTAASPPALTTYTYDVFGNLAKVELPNSDVIEYIIDGQNRRVAKKKNGTIVKRWLYHNDLQPIAELNANGTIDKRFVYASGKNSPDFMVQGNTTYRMLSDQLGSPRKVISTASGATAVQTMRHDEFGNVLQDDNPGFTPFGFAGGLYDPDTGLVRFGARDYDPVVGRWISKDPIRFDGGQANLYVYVGNDPANLTDMKGKSPSAGAIPWWEVAEDGLEEWAIDAGSLLLMCMTLPFRDSPDLHGPCPRCPVPPPNESRVDMTHDHHPCPGAHRHNYAHEYNQNAYTCECFLKKVEISVDCL